MDREQPGSNPPSTPSLNPEDYYFEGDFMVFTAAYHLKRGYCCGSGCRHCPFGNAPADKNQGADEPTLPPEATG
jgi:hypothetical protein